MTQRKWFVICCTAVSACVHQPAQPDVISPMVRIAIGAASDSQNQLLVKVRDATTPRLPLGFASVTVTRLGADSTATSARWDAQSRADGVAAFILPDSGLYEIDVHLIRRTSFRHRLQLATRCRQSLDIYLAETSLPLAVPFGQEAAPRSRGTLTTCAVATVSSSSGSTRNP